MPPIEQNPAPVIEEKIEWKKIFIVVAIVVILVAACAIVWGICTARYITSEQNLYDKLGSMCKSGDGCCQTSVNTMRGGNYKLAQNDTCQEGYKRNLLLCPTTFIWCEPELSTATTSDQSARWKTYIDPFYNYQLSYLGRLESGSDLSAIVIDENSDPVVLCSAHNKFGWSSQQLFENWKNNPPKFITKGMFPEGLTPPCADYPSYAEISAATSTIGNLPVYVVTNLRGPYKTVCTYIANSKTLFAACLPAEDPSKGLWQQHNNIYGQILSSFKFISENQTPLQVCPEEWYANKMPSASPGSGDEYYIYQKVRREISEFDKEWVAKNCQLEKQVVL